MHTISSYRGNGPRNTETHKHTHTHKLAHRYTHRQDGYTAPQLAKAHSVIKSIKYIKYWV